MNYPELIWRLIEMLLQKDEQQKNDSNSNNMNSNDQKQNEA